jgi:molybdenum cofactor guanylyltransferase
LIRHAYILAGGRSSRFGSDKALAEVGSLSSIEVLTRFLRSCDLEVIAVAQRDQKYDQLGIATIGDLIPDRGPLGGILTAVNHSRNRTDQYEGWILVTTCDAIVFHPQWLEQLKSRVAPMVRAIHFDDGQSQPFPGLYHTSLLDQLMTAVESNQRSMLAFLDSLQDRRCALPNNSPQKPMQFNTREQLDACLRACTDLPESKK